MFMFFSGSLYKLPSLLPPWQGFTVTPNAVGTVTPWAAWKQLAVGIGRVAWEAS